MDLRETGEQRLLRESVAAMAAAYGPEYFIGKAKAGEKTDELWAAAGRAGYLGVAVPAEYGGGGAGMVELAIVAEEIAAAGALCCSSSSPRPSRRALSPCPARPSSGNAGCPGSPTAR
jgi:alkylation response protein AidB-like acyl-CoA dehydrogenase